jgi:hypothetical protein
VAHKPTTIASVALRHRKVGHPWFVGVLKMCPYTKLHIPRYGQYMLILLLFDVFIFLDCAFCKWQENNCTGM